MAQATPQPQPSSTSPASRSNTRYSNPAQSSSGVVNIARGLLGIPYVYGGASPSGFDCSGFTQYVFGKAGISIPRTASAQQHAATRVSNPKPGDLVFFGSPAYHVGIYTGNGHDDRLATPGQVHLASGRSSPASAATAGSEPPRTALSAPRDPVVRGADACQGSVGQRRPRRPPSARSPNSTNRTRSMPSCAAHSARTVRTATRATSSTSQP